MVESEFVWKPKVQLETTILRGNNMKGKKNKTEKHMSLIAADYDQRVFLSTVMLDMFPISAGLFR